jgi:hypothetical protein
MTLSNVVRDRTSRLATICGKTIPLVPRKSVRDPINLEAELERLLPHQQVAEGSDALGADHLTRSRSAALGPLAPRRSELL